MQNFIHVIASVGALALPAACASSGNVGAVSAMTAPTQRMQSDGPFLYVANQENASVSVIDLTTNAVVETIDLVALGFPENAKPHHTAVEPDGSYWYVSLIAAGKVLKFSRENELVGHADFETPGMLALHPSRDLLFVGRSMAAVNPPQRIGVVERSSMDIDEVDVFFGRPHALAIHPGGGYVFSGSLAANQIASINLDTEHLELTTLDGATHVMVQFALSPDGRWLVATGELTSKLLVFNLSDPANPRLVEEVVVNGMPWHPTFSPDGRTVWFGNQATNTVTVVDVASWSVADVITGNAIAEPHGIAFAPDGEHVYVSNRNVKGGHGDMQAASPTTNRGNVIVINAATRMIEHVIEVGRYAAGISTQPAR